MSVPRMVVSRLILFCGVVAGVTFGFIDSRPSWDDTGVMAGALLIVTLVVSALAPRRPWATALAIGIWIPLFDIAGSRNYGSLLALAFAFAGAYAGSLLRRAMLPAQR